MLKGANPKTMIKPAKKASQGYQRLEIIIVKSSQLETGRL
jgi:hypothetical protein